jgi:hypothetical protein
VPPKKIRQREREEVRVRMRWVREICSIILREEQGRVLRLGPWNRREVLSITVRTQDTSSAHKSTIDNSTASLIRQSYIKGEADYSYK